MNLYLDVQGFKIENNRFITKELAAYDGNHITHYIFKQPFPFDMLPTNLQNQASWLTKNHHCLEWDIGFTPLHLFNKIINHLASTSPHIYVKGLEKANYIQHYITKPVQVLPDQPCIKKDVPKCFYHTEDYSICALSNVFFLYENFAMY